MYGDGVNLYNQAAENGASVAVIVCLCYDTPGLDLSAGGHERARQGGREIAALINGLPAGGAHITISAHSYGTRVGAAAVRLYGANVDDLIFLGSPGTEGDFVTYMPAGHHFDLCAGGDPVCRVIRPITTLGAKGAIGLSTDGSSGHSQYYRRTSLWNIAQVGLGNYDAVVADDGSWISTDTQVFSHLDPGVVS